MTRCLQDVDIMVFFWYFECLPFGCLGDVHTFGPFCDTTCTFVTMATKRQVNKLPFNPQEVKNNA